MLEIYKHNLDAAKNVLKEFKSSNKACVIHAPSTGKTTIASLVIDELKVSTIYLAPSYDILDQAKEAMENLGLDTSNILFMNFYKLPFYTLEELNQFHPGLLIIDEFQHSGSGVWGRIIDYIEKRNPNMKELGITATPIRDFDFEEKELEDGTIVKDRVDMAEKRFQGHVVSVFTITDALLSDIIKAPHYIRAYYQTKETIANYEMNFKRKYNGLLPKEIEAKLKRAVSYANHTEDILKKYIVPGQKCLFFCKNIQDIKKKIEWLKTIFPEAEFLEYHSKQTKKEQEITMQKIKRKQTTTQFVFAVNKINEGIHLIEENSFDIAIFFRPTKSYRIFIQQLGRILGKKVVTILDFVDNIGVTNMEHLYYEFISRTKKEGKTIETYDFTIEEENLELKEIIEYLNQRLYLTQQEKLDYVYNLVKENPEVAIYYTKERFPDGTSMSGFVFNMITKAKALKEKKELNDEEVYILYTLALIDDLQGRTRTPLSQKEKLDYLYQFVIENSKMALSTTDKNFPDGTSMSGFIGAMREKIKALKKKKELSIEEIYLLYTLAQIDEIQGKTKAPLSLKEKLDYTYQLVIENPKISLTNTDKNFPDGTSISAFIKHMNTKAKVLKEKKELSDEEEYLLETITQIEQIRSNAFLKERIDYAYQLVIEDSKMALSQTEKKFSDGTSISAFIRNMRAKAKVLKEKKELNDEEIYLLYTLAQIDELQGRTRAPLSQKEKLDYLYQLVIENPKMAPTNTDKKFPDGTSISAFIRNMRAKAKVLKEKKELNDEEEYLLRTLTQIEEVQKARKKTRKI